MSSNIAHCYHKTVKCKKKKKKTFLNLKKSIKI